MNSIFWFLVVLVVQSDARTRNCKPGCGVDTAIACERQSINVDCGAGKIEFVTANYGRTEQAPCNPEKKQWPLNCVYPESNATTRRLCDGKLSCSVRAHPSQFGRDPCVGTEKYLQMDYRCVPDGVSQEFACERETLTVDCGPGKIIQFVAANYGRLERCPCNDECKDWPICIYPESNAKTRQLCDGKRSCSVRAAVAQFGRDPCYGTPKYLNMDYRCVPGTPK